VPIGEEHGWWADRDQLSGVPRGRSAAVDDAPPPSDDERHTYWSPESVFEESRRCACDDADPYEILGIDRDASLAEAAAARRRIAKACHPDLGSTDFTTFRSNEERMRRVNQAYDDLRRVHTSF
jgi:hypothetical protein